MSISELFLLASGFRGGFPGIESGSRYCKWFDWAAKFAPSLKAVVAQSVEQLIRNQ